MYGMCYFFFARSPVGVLSAAQLHRVHGHLAFLCTAVVVRGLRAAAAYEPSLETRTERLYIDHVARRRVVRVCTKYFAVRRALVVCSPNLVTIAKKFSAVFHSSRARSPKKKTEDVEENAFFFTLMKINISHALNEEASSTPSN